MSSNEQDVSLKERKRKHKRCSVGIPLSALPDGAENLATLERAYETSLKNRHTFKVELPADLSCTAEWSYSTSAAFLGWNWTVTVLNEKVGGCEGPDKFAIRQVVEVSPTIVKTTDRTQKAIECYAKLKLERHGIGKDGKQDSSPHAAVLGQDARYMYWYPTGPDSRLSLSLDWLDEDVLTNAYFFAYSAKQTAIMEVYDVQEHTVIDFSQPPPCTTANDCILVCEDGMKLYCDGVLLAINSAYFRKLFFEVDFEEKKNMTVSLPDVPYVEMYDFVSALQKQLSPITDANVISRLVLSDRFEAVLLAQACESHLCNVSRLTAEKCLALATQFRLFRLKRHVIDSIGNISEISRLQKDPSYKDLENSTKALLFERLILLQDPCKHHHRTILKRRQDRENDEQY